MRPRQLTALLTFGAAVVVALCVGISIATENYALLIFGATAVIVGILIVMPGHVPLLVFGLLMPFSLPVPFIFAFPFLLVALGIGGVKYWLQRGVQHRKLSRQSLHYDFLDIPTGLFFGWVILRYCLKPSFPNLMGWGMNVTGFRAWLSYAISFGVLFFTGRFVANRAGILNLMRWLAYVSIFFILVFVPATLSKNMVIANLFTQLGMFVSLFDNGMLRFVALPTFGVILFSLALLPNLLPLKRTARWTLVMIALLAIFAGGNRTTFGTALIVAIAIPSLRGKILQTALTSAVVLGVAIGGYLAGPALSQLPQTGLLRPLALVSPHLAESTGGDSNLEWREIRWQLGLEEIRKHPFFGVGYGGLENALESDFQSEEQSQDLSLMTGGIHNGYIAGAVAVGIPAALVFVFILYRNIIVNARRAYRIQKNDPLLSEAHCFVCASLVAVAASMFVGSDLNDPLIWFYFALSTFLAQLRVREKQHLKVMPSFAQPILATQVA